MSAWQPIETAPRDGTPVLLYDGKMFVARWREIDGPQLSSPRFRTHDNMLIPCATHWMPLPAPPVIIEGQPYRFTPKTRAT